MRVYKYKLADMTRVLVPSVTLASTSAFCIGLFLVFRVRNAGWYYVCVGALMLYAIMVWVLYWRSCRPVAVDEECIGEAVGGSVGKRARWSEVKRIERSGFFIQNPRRKYYIVKVYFVSSGRSTVIQFQDCIDGYFSLMEFINKQVEILKIPAYDVPGFDGAKAVPVETFREFRAA